MGDRLIISDNREDPGNPLVLDGESIDAAAQDPLAIGKIMVDQIWAEGTDPTGGGLYYERNSNQHRRLQVFETGSEDFMTGGWVRVLATAEQVRKERPGMERAAKAWLRRGVHRPAAAALRSGAGVRVAGRAALPRLRWPGIRPHRWDRGYASAFLARLRGQLGIQC